MISQTDHKNRMAFSLVELLIVLSLLSICIGLFIPSSLKWIRRSEALLAKSNWEHALRFARLNALEKGIAHEIYFDQAIPALIVVQDGERVSDLPENSIAKRYPCPQEVSFSVQNSSLASLPLIRIDSSGNAPEVTLQIKTGKSAEYFRIHRFVSNLQPLIDQD